MIARIALLLAAAVLAASPCAAADKAVAKTYPGVTDTSFVADNGDRTMRLSIDVPASPARIWQVLSTSQGWQAMGTKTAYVDFRPGGVIETSYRAASPKGDPDNIKNQIVALVPERMLVFRNVQAPRGFKDAALFARVTSVITIEPLGADRSRVTIDGDGYGAGPGFDALYAMFLEDNAYTLDVLKKTLTAGAKR